jgi:ketosteroid isomerase-like protein
MFMASTITQQTAATLHHHLGAFAQGDLDAILSDYTDESVLFFPDSTLHGRDAVRTFFATLLASLPADWLAQFKMNRQEVEGEVAYIFWQAPPAFPLATDTFVVRNNKILVQTFAMLAPA